MTYSIFEDTMADMIYQEIEIAAKKNAVVLLPVAVIEEHGPHMCLGVDTYLAHNTCRNIRNKLLESEVNSLIAPPFYWGINFSTGAFAGSFTVREETMISLLVDILVCLKNWGFKKIFQ